MVFNVAKLVLAVMLSLCPSPPSTAAADQQTRRLQAQSARAACFAADLDDNLQVDTRDILILLAHFGRTVGAVRGDLDGSGGELPQPYYLV